MKILHVFVILAALQIPVFSQDEKPVMDTAMIEQITRLKGTYNAEEKTFRLTQPRTDVKISVEGTKFPPFMGLSSWVAFTAGKNSEAMMMGDLLLFQDEVNPVIDALLSRGISVTALHNHFFFEEPRAYFLHFYGEGSFEELARSARMALDKVKLVRAKKSQPAKRFDDKKIKFPSKITAAPLEEIIGIEGKSEEGMVKFVVGRKATMPCDCEAGKDMGIQTWAAFAGSDNLAVAAGDFAVLEEELQAVVKTLALGGFNIVTIHHHMTQEKPKYLFVHFWGKGKASELAKTVKAVLQVQKL